MKINKLKDHFSILAIAAVVILGATIYAYTWNPGDIVEFDISGWGWTAGFLWTTVLMFIASFFMVGTLSDMHKDLSFKSVWHNTLFWTGVISSVANIIICIVFWTDGPEKISRDYDFVRLLSVCAGLPMWVSGIMAIYAWFNIEDIYSSKYVTKTQNIVPKSPVVNKERDIEFVRFRLAVMESDEKDLSFYKVLHDGAYLVPEKIEELIISNGTLLRQAIHLKTKYPGTKARGLKTFDSLIDIYTKRSELLKKSK